MPKMVTLVTGPIVGLRSTWFLEDTVKFAGSLDRKIEVFNLFEEILSLEGMEADNAYDKARYVGELLDGYQYQFWCLRQSAYLSIASRINALPDNVSAVVRLPASVEWRGINVRFKDHDILARTLKPDRIVTLIDAEWKVMERLKTEYGRHFLEVVAHQEELSLEKILVWLGSEVSMSEDWAEWLQHLTGKKVDHLVLGVETPSRDDRQQYVRDVDNMAKLATVRDLPSFYASYSMTVATEETRSEINDLIWRMRRYGVVIDPASIEIGDEVTPEDVPVVFAYTVCRDLRWDVQKVDIVSAFHPYTDIPPLSTGMMDELGHARAFRKERYLVLPVGFGSPFTGDNYVPKKHLFRSGDAFFAHLEEERKPPLEPRFGAFTDRFGEWQKRRARRKRGAKV